MKLRWFINQLATARHKNGVLATSHRKREATTESVK